MTTSDSPPAPTPLRLALEGRPELAVERPSSPPRRPVELERSHAKPNLSPYFGYKKSGVHSTLIGGDSVPLPIRDRNQGRIAEALAEVDRAEADLRASQARVRPRRAPPPPSSSAAARWSTRSGRSSRARRRDLRIARAAYQEQGVDLLFLLDAQRSLNEIELLYGNRCSTTGSARNAGRRNRLRTPPEAHQ